MTIPQDKYQNNINEPHDIPKLKFTVNDLGLIAVVGNKQKLSKMFTTNKQGQIICRIQNFTKLP